MSGTANIRILLLVAALLAVTAALAPAESNVDYWLTSQPASAPAERGIAEPASAPSTAAAVRTDALPGVVVTSDGKCVAGMLLATAEKDWEVYTDSDRRWRHIPPIVVLSITAKVVDKQMEPEWRWKEMGSDEKVFTGRSKPALRFLWTFRLIDGTTLTGAVKGQPLWVETDKGRKLFVLHERFDGQYGQTLADLVYPAKIVFSRRAMEKVTSSSQ